MAFLHKEIKKSGTYLSICESYRDEAGRVQRRVLRHLDNAKDYNEESLERIGRQLIEIAKGPAPNQRIYRNSAEGFEYIVGDRLKSMGEAAIQHLTNLNNYTTVIIKDSEGNDLPLKYCSYPYNQLVSYSYSCPVATEFRCMCRQVSGCLQKS